jgi:APA family basic amino acid/polyamine antiporter
MISAFGVAMIGVLWAYEGWQSVTYSAGETADPHRTFAKAFLIGILLLITIYLVANIAYAMALGAPALASSENAAADSLRAVAGRLAANAVTVVILISVFSAANGSFLTGPRVYFAMAHDGVFFRRLSEVHPRFGTPALAVVAAGVWSSILAVSGTFEQLTSYVVFAGWIFYALGAAAVFRYRQLHPHTHRPYRVPGYPWTPVLFILSALALVVNTIYAKPVDAAVGLGLILLGLPAYAFWSCRSRG